MQSSEYKPFLTIPMAVHNGNEKVARAIESVLSQDCPSWELICVDDGSTDETLAILKWYAAKDSRIKVISQKNSGAPLARLRAMQEGVGDYILACLDHDDYIASNFVSSMKDVVNRTGADTVLCDMHRETTPNMFLSHFSRNGFKIGQSFSGKEAFMKTFPWQLHAIGMWKRSIVFSGIEDSFHRFDAYNSDEYFSRLMLIKSESVVLGSAKYYYCMNPESVTTRPSIKWVERLATDEQLLALGRSYGLSEAEVWRILLEKRNSIAIAFNVLAETRRSVATSEFCKAKAFCNESFRVLREDLRNLAKNAGVRRHTVDGIIVKLRARQILMLFQTGIGSILNKWSLSP